MSLDSDVPNADSQLFIQFYAFKDEPYKGQTFIRKMSPGDQLNIVERPMREHDKTDFPRQWLSFLAQTSADEVIGTRLKQWNLDRPTEITHAQIDELTMLKFQTVEQVRDASDVHLQRVGMGGPGLREKARLYLAGKNKTAENTELADTKRQFAELQAQVASLLAAKTEEPIKKKRGPKPGFKRVKTDVVHDNAPTHAAGHE